MLSKLYFFINFACIELIANSLKPLAYKNSSKSNGYMRTTSILSIGIEGVFAKVTPNKVPLHMYVNLSSYFKNFSIVKN